MYERFLLFLLLCVPWLGHASAAYENSVRLEQSARAYVEQFLHKNKHIRYEIHTSTLDARLKLHRCGTPFETFSYEKDIATATRINVGIKCAAPHAWQVYVPVEIFRFGKVAVARTALRRGTEIDATAIKWVEKRLEDVPRGYILDPQSVFGMRVGRHIRMESTITPSALAPPLLVRKGEKVTIVANTQGFLIRMGGEAVADGVAGDVIRVKNLSSARIVQAVVIEPGVVQIRL